MNARALPLIAGLLALGALAGLADAQSLYVGESAAGTMAGVGSTHDLSVDLVAGDRVTLKLRARGNARLVPDVVVTSPGGGQASYPGSRNNARLIIAAGVTGTYRIRLVGNSAGDAGFTLNLKGKSKRKYRGTAGSLGFGATQGSSLDVKVRAGKGEMPGVVDPVGSQGQSISLSVEIDGKKLEASGLSGRTDDYVMAYDPPSSKATVEVRMPDPRGQVDLGRAAPAPNAPGPGTGGNNPPPLPPPPLPPPPPPAPAPEPGPATEPAPPPAEEPAGPDHDYLDAMLFEGERGQDLADAVEAVKASLPAGLESILDRFRAELDDGADQALIEKVRGSLLSRRIDRIEANGFSVDRLALLLETGRRLDRAEERHARLEREDGASVLDSAAAFEEAMHGAAERIANGRDALERTIEMSIRAYLTNPDSEVPEVFLAPMAPADRQALDGMRELDQRLLSDRFSEAAHQGDEGALDMMIAAYRTWAGMLAGLAEDAEDPDLALELAEVLSVLSVFEEIAREAAEAEEEAGKVMVTLKALGSEDPAAIEYDLVPHRAIEPDRETGEFRFDAEAGKPQEVYWTAGDSRAWVMIDAGLDNDCRGIELLVRPEETAELAGANLEIVAGGADLQIEESPEGIRIFGSIAADEVVSVRWNVDGRQGGFDLRVAAGQ